MTTDYIIQRELEKVLDLLTIGNRLAMRVAICTGLRIGDVLSIKREKLARQFYVTEAKTGKRRRVNLSEALLSELLEHSAGSVWAFPSPKDPGKHRSRQAVWADVKRAKKAFRMRENVAPHTARKAYAVELMRKYGDLDRVRRALNHRDAGVTAVYAMADVLTDRRLQKRAKSKKQSPA